MALVGRESELQFLNQYYDKPGCHILVVYGQRGVGKTSLLALFGADKACSYYMSRSCSDKEQRFQWARELRSAGRSLPDFPEYEELFECIAQGDDVQKGVLMIDEFHNIVKGDATFFFRMKNFLENCRRELLVILCSSAAGWVENSMVGKLGSGVGFISGFLKVRELGLSRMQEIFPEYSEDDVVQLYSVLGGVPGLWNCIDARLSASENLVRHILDRYGRIYGEMSMYLTGELREPAVYNTILTTMASGAARLNDIYCHTGFSRAKISVYLKNLMELDLVEKVESGIYRITRPYVRFYFRFLFPHLSLLEESGSERFFKEIVEDAFPGFVREAYRK